MLAFADDQAAAEAAQALLDAGFADEDILVYTAGELFPDLEEMMRNASGAAGFGYEVTLMRRYMTLASEGAGWLVVYAPHDAERDKVANFGAPLTTPAHASAVQLRPVRPGRPVVRHRRRTGRRSTSAARRRGGGRPPASRRGRAACAAGSPAG